jgi:O-antigen ligase
MYRTWKLSSGKQKLVVSVLTIAIVIIGINYLSDFYANSDYFQHRMEQTAEGDSSGRDELYNTFWNHFLNEQSATKILFGNGAMQTISIGGNYAHNDWLEILICHGLLGFCIYLLYFITLIRCWLRSKNNQVVYSMLGMLILIMFSSTLFSMSYNSLSLSIAICLGYCLARQNEGKKKYNER